MKELTLKTAIAPSHHCGQCSLHGLVPNRFICCTVAMIVCNLVDGSEVQVAHLM